MPKKKPELFCIYGPENAEHEIRKAYLGAIETCALLIHPSPTTPTVDPNEVIEIYERACQHYNTNHRLAAERWARAAKHLAQALLHEAKIAYLEKHHQSLPYLEGAHDEEYGLYQRSDTTADLVSSAASRIPPGFKQMPPQMRNYLSRAHHHLEILEHSDEQHELLRAERIQATYEYCRALECMGLGYESEFKSKSKAA